ncbi:hypothetical protein [Scytonema sp. NUACC26]
MNKISKTKLPVHRKVREQYELSVVKMVERVNTIIVVTTDKTL